MQLFVVTKFKAVDLVIYRLGIPQFGVPFFYAVCPAQKAEIWEARA